MLDFLDDVEEIISKLPLVSYAVSLVTFVVSLIMYIVQGGYVREIESLKLHGVFCEENFSTGTVMNFYSKYMMIAVAVIGLISTVFAVAWFIAKVSPLWKVLMILDQVVLVGLTVLFVASNIFDYSLYEKLPLISQLCDHIGEEFVTVINGFLILLMTAAAITVIVLASEKGFEETENIAFMYIGGLCCPVVGFGAFPLLLLIVENIIPLAALAVVLAVLGVILFISVGFSGFSAPSFGGAHVSAGHSAPDNSARIAQLERINKAELHGLSEKQKGSFSYAHVSEKTVRNTVERNNKEIERLKKG